MCMTIRLQTEAWEKLVPENSTGYFKVAVSIERLVRSESCFLTAINLCMERSVQLVYSI